MAEKWVDPTQSNEYDSLCEIYNHEFQKHGICYNAFEDNWEKAAVNYFEATLNVHAALDAATQKLNAWAKQEKPETTLDAINALYSKKVQVLCSAKDGVNQFSAIRACFEKPSEANAVARSSRWTARPPARARRSCRAMAPSRSR
ncbi:hypothetical protein PINS_up020384 [Pythium insidiosum]|nr:hypothetical protein PINS_up020384 [Pythium insidiosum]